MKGKPSQISRGGFNHDGVFIVASTKSDVLCLAGKAAKEQNSTSQFVGARRVFKAAGGQAVVEPYPVTLV